MSEFAKMNHNKNYVDGSVAVKPVPCKTDGISNVITKHTSRKLNMKVIALTGSAGSGKDTVANILQLTNTNVFRHSFAKPLKEIAAKTFNLDPFYFDSDNPEREKIHPRWNKSPRQLLQILGTDCLRELVDKDIWIKHAQDIYHLELHKYPKKSMFIITDCRFNNEAEWIKSIGGEIWEVKRNINLIEPTRQHNSKHASETSVDKKYITHTLENDNNDDDFRSLSLKVESLIKIKL